MFDFAKEIGILHRVGDDSECWENRDIDRLRESLEETNRIVASFAGVFKDQMGDQSGQVHSPISDFPNFEHLEADGWLAQKKKKKKKKRKGT